MAGSCSTASCHRNRACWSHLSWSALVFASISKASRVLRGGSPPVRFQPRVEILDAIDDAAAELGIDRSAARQSELFKSGSRGTAICSRLRSTQHPLLRFGIFRHRPTIHGVTGGRPARGGNLTRDCAIDDRCKGFVSTVKPLHPFELLQVLLHCLLASTSLAFRFTHQSGH